MVVLLRRAGRRGRSAQRLRHLRRGVIERRRRAEVIERQRQVRRVVERLRHIVTISYYSKPDNIFADFFRRFTDNAAASGASWAFAFVLLRLVMPFRRVWSLRTAAVGAEHESAGPTHPRRRTTCIREDPRSADRLQDGGTSGKVFWH